MAPYQDWAILAAFVFAYSTIAGRIEKTWISGAIVFVAFGLLAGPSGLGILQFDVESEDLRTLAELTLAVILFTDAANANLPVLKNSVRLPTRLLLLGLPLTILLGFGVGRLLFPDITLLEAGILATMLAPTDAALGKAVVTNPNVPDRIREDLNVESGLNDGICVPILFGLLAFATHEAAGGDSAHLIVGLFAKQIGIGVLVGGAYAAFGSQWVKFCSNRTWLSDTWQRMTIAAIALACFSTSQVLGGSGFIASFVGGLVFGGLAKNYKENLLKASEANGDTLSLITWVAFGSVAVGSAIGQIAWSIVLYAILSLTVVRIVPVFLCLSGLALDAWTKLFVGWFGPRGLASIVFAVIVLDENLSGGHTLTATVSCTIVLSILAHGLTANPWARLYGQQMQNRAG